MQTSLTDEHVEQKRAIANRVKTIVAIALSAVIIVSFFFPYIRFVFSRYILSVDRVCS